MAEHAKRVTRKRDFEMNENLKEWIKDVLFAILFAFLILQFIMPTVVKESSMENTLIENDYLIVSKKAYKIFGDCERGDVIVFQSRIPMGDGSDDKKLLVKRIIAIGGDTISISGGKVYVNGEEIKEDYLKDGTTNGEMAETAIPEGYLFCMGDNRLVSRDSRDASVGLISEDDVKGKVVLRLFPIKKFGKIK